MKRINGTGCIRRLSGNRTKPYQALITNTYDKLTRKQTFKSIGTFKNQFDAETALHQYLSDYNFSDKKLITLKEIYNSWSSSKFKNLSINSVKYYKTAFNYIKSIQDVDIKDVNLSLLQNACNSLTPSQQRQFKKLIHMLLDYAIVNDYISKNYSKYLVLDKLNHSNKNLFTSNEIKYIIENDNALINEILEVLLFTGLRINELINLRTCDIDLSNNIINITNSKTASGVRKIPIHNSIKHLMYALLSNNNTYLFNYNNNKINYETIRLKFKNEYKNHIFHETRHTFITQCKKCNIDPYAIKLIVGHSINDITLSVYTHTDLKYLEKELNKLNYY